MSEEMKVNIEHNNQVCTGYVLSRKETGRTIASFWYDYDAEHVSLAVNGFHAMQETIAKQAERIRELTEALISSNKQLADSGNELADYINSKNEELKNGICCTDLDEPDYHDHQTVYDSMKLIELNDKLLAKEGE